MRLGSRIGFGVLIFLGSLLGSLLGTFAQLNDLAESFSRVQTAFYPELCIVGSDTILGEGLHVAQDWADGFERTHDVRVSVNATGSGAGVRLAAEGGCAHVLAMSEPISSGQLETLNNAGIQIDCAAEIGYDILAFVTHIDNAVNNIADGTLRGILLGEMSDWSQVGGRVIGAGEPIQQPIYILARPGSGTTDFVLRNFGNYPYSDVETFPAANYIPCADNDTCLDATLSLRGSLYWVSVAWLRTQPQQYLRVIPLLTNDEAPINILTALETQETSGERFDIDRYPGDLTRPLYMYVLRRGADARNDNAVNFLRYVRGIEGQQIMEQYYFFTHFNPPRDVSVPLPPGFPVMTNGVPDLCQPQ